MWHCDGCCDGLGVRLGLLCTYPCTHSRSFQSPTALVEVAAAVARVEAGAAVAVAALAGVAAAVEWLEPGRVEEPVVGSSAADRALAQEAVLVLGVEQVQVP